MTSPREIYLGYPNHFLHLFGRKHLYIIKPSVRIKLTFGQSTNYVNGRPSVPSDLPGGLFLKNKLSESLEQKNSKPLWRYIKSKRQDGNGVSPLKENGQLHSDSRRKAEILNNQFCSVFTSELGTTNISKPPGPPNTEIPKFEITVQGVTKLLEGLSGEKAPGPDELPNDILKNAANEISPFLKIIFDQSLQTGKLPDDWVEANVAPVFKKGDRHSPAKYRPISPTYVFVPNYSNTSFVNKLCPIFRRTKLPYNMAFAQSTSLWLQLINLFKILKARHKQMLLS